MDNILYKVISQEEPPIHEEITYINGGQEEFKEINGLKPKMDSILRTAEEIEIDNRILQKYFNNRLFL